MARHSTPTNPELYEGDKDRLLSILIQANDGINHASSCVKIGSPRYLMLGELHKALRAAVLDLSNDPTGFYLNQRHSTARIKG